MKGDKTLSKRILAIILLFTMLVSSLPINSIIAAGKVTISLEGGTANRGEEITVNVNLSNNPGLRILGGTVSFDRDRLEYVSSEVKNLENVFQKNIDYNETTGNIVFYMASEQTESDPITANGTLASITFRVKNDASGVANVNIAMDDVTINKGEYVTDYVTNDTTVTITVPPTGVSLDRESLTLEKGATEKLVATVSPSDATNKNVTWSSENSNIASVDSNGNVTAKAKGITKITATIGDYSANCNVTVTQPIEGIELDKTALDLERGDTEKLTATVTPENADGDKTVTWSSNNPNIADVDQNGNVTAVNKGNAIITAAVGDKTDTCNVTVGVALQSISINKTEITLNKDTSETLTVSYNPIDTDADKTVNWTSSNTAVATVDEQGKVTAVGKGTATIKAIVGDKEDICEVTVVIPLQSISIKSSTQIQYGQSEKLVVTYNPIDTTDDTTVIWTSSKEDVATVSTDGTINAVGVGTATITARVGDNITSTCEVTVLPVPLNSISIKEQNIELVKGETKELTVLYNPENTSDNKTVTWTSDKEDIVKIDGGTITAVGAGKAIITATVGNISATTTVNVNVPLESITLNKQELILNKGNTIDVDIIYNPVDTTIEKVEDWKSSDTSVVTVDENGIITAQGRGTAYITATVAGKEATCKVTVNVPLTGIDLKAETELIKGQTEKLVVKLLPEDTTENPEMVWTSKNPEVADVSNDGIVTAKKEGTAEIVVKVGNFEKTCIVTVKEIKIDTIEINVPDFELGLGRSQTLGVIINPNNTTDDKTISWSSSDDSIVSVDEYGKVTAKGYGTATITATVGDKTATVDITVVEIPIGTITVDVENSKVNIGDTIKLNINLEPTDATNKDTVRITSSNPDVVFIDENGNIIAKSAGKAIISVEAENGIKDQIEIEVIEPVIEDGTVENEGVTGTNEITENNENNKTEVKTTSPHTGDIAVEGLTILMIISAFGIIFISKKRK